MKINPVSTSKIISEMEQGFHDTYLDFTRAVNGIASKSRDMSWTMVKPTWWPNLIFNTDIDVESMSMRADEVVRLIEKNKAPNSWFIGPSDRPKKLREHLVQCGFKLLWDAPGMAIDISNADLEPEKLKGFEIKKVSDLGSLYEWTRLPVTEISGGDKQDIDNWHNLLKMVLNKKEIILYLGSYEGLGVASTMLYQMNGIAGIWHVATDRDNRRKGFGTQMVLQALIDAKKNGCQMGTLFSSKIAKSIYERIGFKEYCTISCYGYKV